MINLSGFINSNIPEMETDENIILKGFINIPISKSFSSDIEDKFPGGEWKTINGAKVYVHDGKVVAGLEGFNGKIDDFFAKKETKTESKEKRVKHDRFGEGTVLSEDGQRIKIKFDEHGEKELLKKFAKLTDIDGNKVKNDSDKETKEKESKEDIVKPEKTEKKKKEFTGVKDESIKIKRETQKAKLLEKDGVEFWVKNKWYNEESGKLTPAGEKSFEEAKEKGIKNKEVVSSDKFKIEGESESGKAYKMTLIINDGIKDKEVSVYMPKSKVSEANGKVTVNSEFLKEKQSELQNKYGTMKSKHQPKETDKAYGFPVNLDYYDIEKDITKYLWFPKSQITKNGDDYIIPKWIYDKKVEEFLDDLGGSRTLSGVQGTRGGGVSVEFEYAFEPNKIEIKKAISFDIL